MATYTIVLFVALAMLGALIAYLGDLVGAWLGKRRSTLFGMRPRRSARLIAAIVGAILPLLGLGVATLGSQYARIAVFQLRSIIQQREKLTGEVADLQAQVSDYETRIAEAEERAGDAEAQAAALLVEQAKAEEQIAELTARRDELASQRNELSGQVDDLRKLQDRLQNDLDSAREDLRAAQEKLQIAQSDLRAAQADLSTTQQELDEKRKAVTDLGNQVAVLERELDPMQRRLEATQSELQDRISRLSEAEQQLEDVEAQLEQVLRRHELVASQQPAFEPGDELIRVVIAADETQDQMEADLYELLHLAGAAARRRGAQEGANGRAVIVVAPIPRWAAGSEVPEGMIVRNVASELRTGGADEWVVIVRAFRRFFVGDSGQLAVEFWATPNRLVFHKGEVLDEFTVPSSDTALQAFEKLWLHIANRPTSTVRARAFAAGMLPQPDTGNYGTIDFAQIFRAVDEIRGGDGEMRVRVTAAEDTYTRGPLLLDIEVTPIDESP